MFIFFIVIWIIAIYCIFRNIVIENNVKILEKNYDPEDDPDEVIELSESLSESEET